MLVVVIFCSLHQLLPSFALSFFLSLSLSMFLSWKSHLQKATTLQSTLTFFVCGGGGGCSVYVPYSSGMFVLFLLLGFWNFSLLFGFLCYSTLLVITRFIWLLIKSLTFPAFLGLMLRTQKFIESLPLLSLSFSLHLILHSFFEQFIYFGEYVCTCFLFFEHEPNNNESNQREREYTFALAVCLPITLLPSPKRWFTK